jgi:hypothetical protein
MKYWDKEYFEKAFPEVSKDYIVISCFGMQLRNWDRMDKQALKNRWLQLRDILTKYMDESDSNFTKIEEHYNPVFLPGLPKITPGRRPARLPRKWWDEHPNRVSSLDRIALIWRLRKAPPCKYEDICGADVKEDGINGENVSLKLKTALEEDVVAHEEDWESITTKREIGSRYLLQKRLMEDIANDLIGLNHCR